MNKKTSGMVFPGENIAEIEEFEAGNNTFTLDGTIRSTVLGNKAYDSKRRTIKIDPINPQDLPKIGDVVMGFVEMLFGPMISIKMFSVNNKPYGSGLSAIASGRTGNNKGGWNRDRYNRKPKSIYRIGDIVRERPPVSRGRKRNGARRRPEMDRTRLQAMRLHGREEISVHDCAG